MIPSPVVHPNAYAGFSVAAATTLVITEAARLGVTLDVTEAGFIVGAVVWAVLFFGKKVNRGGTPVQ